MAIDIGIKWIVAIILGIFVIYLLIQGIFQRFVPEAEESLNVKVALMTNDLVRECRTWSSNMMLNRNMPYGLLKAVLSPDLSEEQRWDFCEDCWNARWGDSCLTCKAACVKLLTEEAQCRVNPGKFPDTFDYDMKSHTATFKDGTSLEMDYNLAYLYCIEGRIEGAGKRAEEEVAKLG